MSDDWMKAFTEPSRLVSGATWKCRMSNGALFTSWTPRGLSRAEGKALLLRAANGSYCGVYTPQDIASLWRVSGGVSA